MKKSKNLNDMRLQQLCYYFLRQHYLDQVRGYNLSPYIKAPLL